MSNKELAVEELVNLMQVRKDKDGFAWCTRLDSRDIMHRYDLDKYTMAGVWKRVAKKFGRKIERFHGTDRVVETIWLINHMRMTGLTEKSPDLEAGFSNAFPGVSLSGPLLMAARNRVPRPRKPRKTPSAPRFKELDKARSLLQEIDRLVEAEKEHQSKLRDVREQLKKLRKYRRVTQQFVRATEALDNGTV